MIIPYFTNVQILVYKYKSIFLFVVFFIPISLYPVYADEPLDQFVLQGILVDVQKELITDIKDITLQIYLTFIGDSPIWSEEHNDVHVDNGLFTIYVGSQTAFSSALNFTNALYLEIIIKDSDGNNAEILSPKLSIAAVPFALSASRASTDFDLNSQKIVNATNMPAVFHNKTSIEYTGDLELNDITGYSAGNDICDQAFSGTHMCTEAELILTLEDDSASSMQAWSGLAWVITGGAKFAPAPTPVNDCNGFTHGERGQFLGNVWQFDQSGGSGSTVFCNIPVPLACCKPGV